MSSKRRAFGSTRGADLGSFISAGYILAELFVAQGAKVAIGGRGIERVRALGVVDKV
jgi:hypothetical protein